MTSCSIGMDFSILMLSCFGCFGSSSKLKKKVKVKQVNHLRCQSFIQVPNNAITVRSELFFKISSVFFRMRSVRFELFFFGSEQMRERARAHSPSQQICPEQPLKAQLAIRKPNLFPFQPTPQWW